MTLINKNLIHYIRSNFDEVAIITCLASINRSNNVELSEQDLAVLSALHRTNPALSNASTDEIRSYLQNLDDNQITGLVSNVKGVLHEMEFIRLENEDGDSVYASIFQSVNHPDTDVMLIDRDTGDSWETQLKATDDTSYVQDWIDNHPDGEILVTDEIANKMDLQSSGFSNEEITADVNDFVDKMIDSEQLTKIIDYFPELSIISIAIIVQELWERYQRNEINFTEFKELVAIATGLKIAKVGLLIFLLSIPIVGQLTAALMIASFLINAKSTWFDHKPKL